MSSAFSCSFCRWLRSVIFSSVPVMVAFVMANLREEKDVTRKDLETAAAAQHSADAVTKMAPALRHN